MRRSALWFLVLSWNAAALLFFVSKRVATIYLIGMCLAIIGQVPFA